MAAEVISIYTTMLEGICFLREIPEKAFGSDQKAGKRGVPFQALGGDRDQIWQLFTRDGEPRQKRRAGFH